MALSVRAGLIHRHNEVQTQIQRLLSSLQWRNITFCILLPLYGIFLSLYYPLKTQTLVLAVMLYIASGVGITAGYHRLWSHRSFTASISLRYFLAICGASSVQGSILVWCRDHRAHHRYVDTPKDPYNVQKGLLWSHMGWLIFKPDPTLIGRVSVSDLTNDRVVMWQHDNFPFLCIFFAYVLPCIVAQIGWNDGIAGLLYAGIIRVFLFQQATNCVNSLAHYLGEQPFADAHSARNHVLTAFITFGEGYHNFHHEFPSDYRNGIRWFDYDPTKWFISLWEKLGVASDLKRIAPNEINKAVFQQKMKDLQGLRGSITWGIPLESLPVYTWDELQTLRARIHNPLQLICIAGVIYEVSGFVDSHPGGKAVLLSQLGSDVTVSFNGGVYKHSKAASNLLENMRFGILQDGVGTLEK